MSDEFPKGWTETAIWEIAEVSLGKTPGKADYRSSGSLKVVKFRDIQNAFIDFQNSKDGFVAPDVSVVSTLRELQRGDVLITSAAHSGENIGKKCAFVSSLPGEFERVFFTGELLNIRCREKTLSRWAYFFFRSADGFEEIQEAVKGVHLTSGRARLMIIPFAPLNEQLRIVAKLEKLLGIVDACQKRLSKIPTLLKRFRQSVLAAACTGRLTADWRDKNPDVEPAPQLLKRVLDQVKQKDIDPSAPDMKLPNTWSFVLSKYLFSFVTSGSRGWAQYYSDEGPLFLRIGNLNHGTIYLDLRSVRSVRPPLGVEGTRTRVQANDILVSITADVGMIALVPENIEEAYINQHISLARPIKGVSPKFISWYLASNEGGLKQFQELQRGMTKVGLGLDDIKSIWVPFPPLEEQHEIVRRVEAFFMFADQIEAHFAKAKARVDQLTQSLLTKAFSGNLVPQDPNDEPASVLLERIKAERTKRVTEAKGGGKKRLNVDRKSYGR
jgi:type I restriction enzyme S subunit